MHKKSLIYSVAIGLACLLTAWFALRGLIPGAPVLIAPANNTSAFQYRDGSWYWLERAGTPAARLVRLTASKAVPIAAQDRISAYSAADGKVAWSGREGAGWTVRVAAGDGSGMQTIWSGAREPQGLCLAENRVFWLETLPPVVADSAPLPPLGGRVNIVAVPLAGGAPSVVAALMEPEGQRVIGVHDGQVYAMTFRPEPAACTVLYRAPLAGGVPYRIAAELSAREALLTRDGVLYWTAESPEAPSGDRVTCVRRLTKNGTVETLEDWMPSHGKLYETNRGVCYVDLRAQAAAWPLHTVRELPKSYPAPDNYTVLAAGGEDMLLQPIPSTPAFSLYRLALP